MFKEMSSIQTEFGKDKATHIIYDSEFTDYFIVDYEDKSIKDHFIFFLNCFYDTYNDRNKNPIPSIIKLMSLYSANQNKFKLFLKSKGINNVEKYMVLL